MSATWKIERPDGREHVVRGVTTYTTDGGMLITSVLNDAGKHINCGFFAAGQWVSARQLSKEESDDVDDKQFAKAALYHVRCPKCGRVMPSLQMGENGSHFVLDCCGQMYKRPTILLEPIE